MGLFSQTSGSSLIELLDQLELHTDTPLPTSHRRPKHSSSTATKRPRSTRQNLRSQKVIARSSDDGFYYPGVVLTHGDGRHITVKLADGQQTSVLRKFVIPMGGAAPCPILQIGDHVLAQVRTKGGPHPSLGGSCDYFIPGTIQVLPENGRVSRALHTVLVFNGRAVTCPRRGVVKITESLYRNVCKFITLKMSKFHSKMKQKSEDAEYTSDFSDGRSTQVSSRRSSAHSSLSGSHTHSETERSVSRLSETVNGLDETKREHEAEIQSLLENQQTQGEMLERYQQDLQELQERQRLIEEQLANKKDGDERIRRSKDHTWEEEAVDIGNRRGYGVMENRVCAVQRCDQGVNTGPMMEEKAVETDPMTESRGVGTEWSPSHNSIGSEPEREEEEGEGERGKEDREGDGGEALNEFPSNHTLSPLRASTPVPSSSQTHRMSASPTHSIAASPTHSIAASPTHSMEASPTHSMAASQTHSTVTSPTHRVTASPTHTASVSPGSQSKLSTPNHTITPTLSHQSTPSQSPSHRSTPSPTPVHTSTPTDTVGDAAEQTDAGDTLEQQTESVSNKVTEEPKDLSSIAQRLVELGVDAFVGREVLVRWPDDGWHYRAKVVRSVGEQRYEVMDACEDLETVHLSNMITDTQDAETLLKVKL